MTATLTCGRGERREPPIFHAENLRGPFETQDAVESPLSEIDARLN